MTDRQKLYMILENKVFQKTKNKKCTPKGFESFPKVNKLSLKTSDEGVTTGNFNDNYFYL